MKMPVTDETMNGRICLVTGATSGIGAVTAKILAEKGATVIIHGRNPEKTAVTVDQIKRQTGNPNVEFLLADLSSQQEIRLLAREFKRRRSSLHVLVNNAGGLFLKRQLSADGIEVTFALNHLGYFLLTNLLLDALKAGAPARIVNVASVAHRGARINFANLQTSGWEAYKQSKLANILFTYELSRRLAGSGVTANTLHPGLVASNFGMNNGGLFRALKPVINYFSISNEQGAQTSIYLASSPEVEGISGQYFIQKKAVRSSDVSYDRGVAARLWQASGEMTGIE